LLKGISTERREFGKEGKKVIREESYICYIEEAARHVMFKQ
jgi:hypothetical protein